MDRVRHVTVAVLAGILFGTVLSCSRTDVGVAPAIAGSPEDLREPPTGHMPPWHHGLIHGTNGDDVIVGTAAGERIEALAGRDRVDAGPSNDILNGGPGADILMGGPGDDVYVEANGEGGDILIEEGGTDTLELAGVTDESAIEVLRHGEDLIVRWSRDNPLDVVLIRSWFADRKYQIERIRLARGKILALPPLADRARQASSEDLIHFPSARSSIDPSTP